MKLGGKDGEDGIEIKGTDSGFVLHDVVQNWYKTLRIASVIALLSILIYAGIKILLSVSAEQTAKYKEFLKDWVIALIMVAGIHYFMVFVIEASNSLMGMLNTANSYNIVVFRPGFDKNKNVQDVLEFPLADGITMKEGLDYTPMGIASGTFIGEARFFAGEGDWAYLLIYLVLTIYSIMFSWIYLKRVIYLAFLTIVAPLVAFSYPLDKMGDGSAQAFKFWVREYTFNVLVQPLHLFIYLVIVTAAQDLADTNPIYALVAIGSIFAFEKVVRQMLGFNKTQSAPTLTGGAAVLTLGNTLLNRAKSVANSGNNNDKEEAKVRTDRKVDSENKNRDPYSQGSINGNSNNSVRVNSNNEDDGENVQERLEQGDDGQRDPIGGAEGTEESGETNDVANQSNDSDNGGSDGNHDEVDVNVENEDDNEKKKDTLRVGTLIVDSIQANTSTVGSTNLGGPNGGDPNSGGQNGGGQNGGGPNGGGQNGGGPNGGDPDDGNPDDEEPDDEEPDDYEDEFDEFYDNEPANNANTAMSDFAARKRALKNQVKSNKKQARKMKRRQQSERTTKQIVGFAKKAGKFAGKLPMAALLATYGAAIGIASGDAGKVAGLTAAGAAGGAALGGAINNKIGDSVKELQKNREEDKEAYEKALYGESYSDLKNIEADKAFMKDKEIDKKYRDEFEQEQGESVRHYDKRIKEIKQHALDYRSHGITDDDTIIQAIKLEEEARSGAITDAAERANYLSDNMYDIAKFAQQCPKNEEGILAFEERLIKGYQSAFEKNNMDKEEARQKAEENAAAIIQAIRRMRG